MKKVSSPFVEEFAVVLLLLLLILLGRSAWAESKSRSWNYKGSWRG
jgi:hypothetical protein